jgi:hypothetical protein
MSSTRAASRRDSGKIPVSAPTETRAKGEKRHLRERTCNLLALLKL